MATDRPKIIHVHQQRIRRNIGKAPEEREPPIIVIDGKARRYGSSIRINGPCEIVYSPDKPLACGARLWVSTESEVIVLS